MARQRGIEVELHQLTVAMRDHPARKHLQAFQQGRGFGPAVRLDQTCDHFNAFGLTARGGGQHLGRLADARRHAEIDLQPAAPRLPSFREQGVRIWSGQVVVVHKVDVSSATSSSRTVDPERC